MLSKLLLLVNVSSQNPTIVIMDEKLLALGPKTEYTFDELLRIWYGQTCVCCVWAKQETVIVLLWRKLRPFQSQMPPQTFGHIK